MFPERLFSNSLLVPIFHSLFLVVDVLGQSSSAFFYCCTRTVMELYLFTIHARSAVSQRYARVHQFAKVYETVDPASQISHHCGGRRAGHEDRCEWL